MEWLLKIIILCEGLLALSFGLAFIRLVMGPSLPDRVVALDVMAMLGIALLTLNAIHSKEPLLLDVAMGMALILFLGTVAFARYLEKNVKNAND